MRKLPLLALFLVSLTGLSGCATNGVWVPAAAEPELSVSCGSGVIFEWDGSTGSKTRKEAIQYVIDIYERELDASLARENSVPTEDDSPVRLNGIIRGLNAALVQVEVAERDADPKSTVVVNGMLKDLKISEVFIRPIVAGGYVVDHFNTASLTSDDPYCAKRPRTYAPQE